MNESISERISLLYLFVVITCETCLRLVGNIFVYITIYPAMLIWFMLSIPLFIFENFWDGVEEAWERIIK